MEWPTNDNLIRAKMLLDLITEVERRKYLNGITVYNSVIESDIKKWKDEYYSILKVNAIIV